MSIDLVKYQIKKFLKDSTAEVLAIKGEWGVGKTYSWQKYIEEFKDECSLKSYSYVSLFGIDSITELKKVVFLNAVDIDSVGDSPNVKGYAKKIATLVKDTKIPYVSRYTGGIGSLINSVSQLSMNNTVICFDDLERHSKGVSIKDFMGLVSFFKEQKKCKIVLLLNEEVGDEAFKDYQKYKEKIVDRQLNFEPTPEECFDAMFTEEFDFRCYVRECCVGLGIRNKRVIRKIVEHTKEFLELVDGFHESIKKQVIHSTVVLSWCYYCHGEDEHNIPNFSFVNKSGVRIRIKNEDWPDERMKRWNEALNQYGYSYGDEIDMAVANGIEQGFLDKERLISLCENKKKEIDIQESSVKWDEAWKIFHGSFSSNEEDIAIAFENGMKDIAATASASQYSSGLKVLREIGKDEKAEEMIEFFIKSKSGRPESLNVDTVFSFEVKDEMFVERLRESYSELKPNMTVSEILELRRGSKSYNSSEADILEGLTEDEIYDLFNGFEGEELTDYIRVFMLLGGSNIKLADKVNKALDRISNTSKLNKSRMAKFRN